MNDNRTNWERRSFDVRTHGGVLSVDGMTRGAWGVFDWDANGLGWDLAERISITHIPTGRRIGLARHGAKAMAVVDALNDEPRFALITDNGNAVVGLRDVAIQILSKFGATFTTEDME